uniref:Uncharacterized protein n=1 Tax=Arundo donax TaxID=35708 RepID=A0A0A8YA34_ARUDO
MVANCHIFGSSYIYPLTPPLKGPLTHKLHTLSLIFTLPTLDSFEICLVVRLEKILRAPIFTPTFDHRFHHRSISWCICYSCGFIS